MGDFFKQYIVLILFVGLTLLGIAIRYLGGEDSLLWKIWEVVDISLAVALGALAFIAYRDMVKDEDEIKIYFKLPDNKIVDTHLSLLRQNATRSEILGVLGMIQKNHKERFTICSLQELDFLHKVHALQKGREKSFYITLQPEELSQFKVDLS